MDKQFRRVKWKVRRRSDGWLPMVFIGEEPIAFGVRPCKKTAKLIARQQAAAISARGQS